MIKICYKINFLLYHKSLYMKGYYKKKCSINIMIDKYGIRYYPILLGIGKIMR